MSGPAAGALPEAGLEGGSTRSRVAESLGIGIGTLLYYERVGLLDVPRRSPGGYRIYSERDLSRLGLISRAKGLGFSPAEIALLVRGLAQGLPPGELRAGLVRKAEALAGEIAGLESRRQALLELAGHPSLGSRELLERAAEKG